jgi:hypothetical protein
MATVFKTGNMLHTLGRRDIPLVDTMYIVVPNEVGPLEPGAYTGTLFADGEQAIGHALLLDAQEQQAD